jgi:hypothetical protein
MTDEEHQVSTTPEKRGQGANAQVRHRGRCSCGRSTFMHYSTLDAARTAMNRTHIAELNLGGTP